MDSFTGLSRDNCEQDIKSSKRYIRGQMLWLVFNLAITCFDWQTLTQTNSVFNGVAFGAMLITSLWSFIFLLESCNELKNEKRKYRFLTELHETQLASGERQQYLSAKQYYEQLRESLEKDYVTRA